MTQPQRPTKARPLIAEIILGATIGATIGAAGFFAYRAWAPPGAPGKAPDSGIRACEAMRDSPVGEDGKAAPLTEARYRQVRVMFADSRDPDIRDNGTKLIDIAWQVGQDESKALTYMGPLMAAASDLQSACADHGVILPS